MRRRKNTKRNLLILAAIAALAIIALLIWRNVFVVRRVAIEGDVQATHEELIRAAKVKFGGHISGVNEETLRKNLESGGKYALDGMRISYPNTLILTIRQRTRDAVVTNGGKHVVLDSDGYVIEVSEAMPEDCGVYVFGLGDTSYRLGGRIIAPEERLFSMKIVLDAARSQGAMEYISDLDVSDARNLRITTRTGITVELGDESSMENKMLWLRSAVSDLESRGENHGTLDISSGDKADYHP